MQELNFTILGPNEIHILHWRVSFYDIPPPSGLKAVSHKYSIIALSDDSLVGRVLLFRGNNEHIIGDVIVKQEFSVDSYLSI